MTQKIILKVRMQCDKCRTKALKIAAAAHGVDEIAIQGAERDQLVVIGDEVDSVKLACALRKELHFATILSVEEKKEEKKDEKKEPQAPSSYAYCPKPQYFIAVESLPQDPCQATVCSIM